MPSGFLADSRKVLRATVYSTGIGSRRISTLRLMPSAVLLVISIFSPARYCTSRSLMNCSNGVAMASVVSFVLRMASITLDMSVIAGNPDACDRRSASWSPKPRPRRTTGGTPDW